jgi:hypothetical protein
MDKLLSWVRSFGNSGAVANANRLHEEHRTEDWILRGLALRVASPADDAGVSVAS